MNRSEFVENYRLDNELSSDQVATTMKAADRSGRPVRVHLLHAHLERDPVILQAFLAEYRNFQRLNHPGLPEILEIVESPPAIVTADPDCVALIGNSPKHFADVLSFVRSLTGIIEYAHSQAVVFRDLSPAGLGIRSDSSCVIPDAPRSRIRDMLGLSSTTMVGSAIEYLAPEVLYGDNCEPRSDLFSLGRIMQQMISGPPGIPTPRWFSDLAGDLTREISRRPADARQVVELLIAESPFESESMIPCFYCLEDHAPGLPICPHCGKEPPDIRQLDSPGEGEALVVRRVSEKEEILAPFMKRLKALSGDPGFNAELLTGDIRMYGKEEKERGLRLPAIIMDRLSERDIHFLIDAMQQDRKSDLHLLRYPAGRISRAKSGPLIPEYNRRSVSTELIEAARALLRFDTVTPGGSDAEGDPGGAEPEDSAGDPEIAVSAVPGDPGAGERGNVPDLPKRRSGGVELLLRLMSRLPAALWDSPAVREIREKIQAKDSELTDIDRVLAGMNLGDVYNRIHSLNRRIAREENTGETGRLIEEKLHLVESFEKFHDAERRKIRLRTELNALERQAEELLENRD